MRQDQLRIGLTVQEAYHLICDFVWSGNGGILASSHFAGMVAQNFRTDCVFLVLSVMSKSRDEKVVIIQSRKRRKYKLMYKGC